MLRNFNFVQFVDSIRSDRLPLESPEHLLSIINILRCTALIIFLRLFWISMNFSHTAVIERMC